MDGGVYKVRMMLSRYVSAFCLVVVLLVYGLWIGRHVEAWAGGSDSSGYMNNARLLERMEFKLKRREIEGLSSKDLPSFTYVPLGFVPVGEHEMVPTYPMGLPLMILGLSSVVGWDHAANTAMLLNALLAVATVYCLSIVMGLSLPLALLSTVFLGFSSLFVLFSLQLMSDVPALAWCAVAILSALLSSRNASWALLAGAAFSMCVLIRPANLLLLLPLAVIFGFAWKRWLLFGLGGIPGAIFQAKVNLQLYGSVFTTGYGDVRNLFRAKYLGWSAQAYARWLPVCLTPALIFLAGVPFVSALRGKRSVIALVVWAAVFLGFYAFYFHTSETWWYLRFVLPAFGAMIVLMLLVMREAAARFSGRVRWTLGLTLMALAIGWNVIWIQRLGVVGRGEASYLEAAAWAKEKVPRNAVILSMQTSGSLLYYTGFTIVRYDEFDRVSFAGVEQACITADRPIYAMLFPFETDEVLRIRAPGNWTRIGSIEPITIWRREPT